MPNASEVWEVLPLYRVVQARSGDKGDAVDISVFSPNKEVHEALRVELTPERVKAHFGDYVKGSVSRFEVPNLFAFKFVCKDALGGGGAGSLRSDNLGKSFSANLLRMSVNLPVKFASQSKIFSR
ncbi:AtuA-related protein [Halioxenophilus aromaticivorans]|uniref:AtuA-like ferredoxin-fold domain-containing protein n=1 Tax=Halioxenophilus aromaticivorans TaxID=1306992 RepID=A0AAV3TX79_9ALTE